MDPARGARPGSISRRQTLTLLGAMAAMRSAGAAESAILRPATLDHVNIRVTSVARSAAFYTGLFDTPVLRNAALRARPGLPPGEAYFLRFGDGYLVMSQAFPPDIPGLDHYSVGLRDYEQATLAAKLQNNGIAAEPRSVDIWARDPDGSFIQLRAPGGWARQSAAPQQGAVRVGPALSPLSMSRIALRSADLAHAGDYYGRLFGTEIASAASSRSRAFAIGDSVLELISVPANSAPAPRPGMDHIRIAIKDFNAETVGRILRERGIGIESGAATGVVRVNDPDGIGIELAATN
jgi:catechol 2,3-dioxygenase-like lactoylglutathione lyase family enzyme